MKRIKYQYLSAAINRGTEEKPDIEQVIISKTVQYSEENLIRAKAEAYNGKVTVEDVEEPEAPPTTDQRVAELEEAMKLLLSGVTE